MTKIWINIIFLLCLGGSLTAQTYPLPMEKVDSVMAQHAKPILVLLSTDWCQYCQMQKTQLQKNKAFQNSGEVFYYVEFDAESKEKVSLNNQKFSFQSTKRLHDLALSLNGSDKISFPTWVLLDTDYQAVFTHNGVLLPAQLQDLLAAIEKASLQK